MTIRCRALRLSENRGSQKAEEVRGAQRDRLFAAQAELMPFFLDYQSKTKRQIPVLTLTRIA
jgi:hypothetical protein